MTLIGWVQWILGTTLLIGGLVATGVNWMAVLAIVFGVDLMIVGENNRP